VDLLRREVPATSLVVAVDPGKVFKSCVVTTGERGLISDPGANAVGAVDRT
jgi:hypothetical protein